MKKLLKCTSIILALIMIASSLSLLSVSVSAKTYSGSSGSIKWSFNEGNKTLTITPKDKKATYKMPKYTAKSKVPWNKYSDKIYHIAVNEGVSRVEQGGFNWLTKAVDVYLSKTVNSISSLAFTGCSALTKFKVNSKSTYYNTEGGVLFNKDKSILIFYPRNKSGASYSIPSTVTKLASCAFYGNKNLTSVTQKSGSVTFINDKAFKNASKLKSVTIKNNCIKLGGQVFYGSLKLTAVEIPPSVTSIGKNPFSASAKMKNMTITVAVNSTAYNSLKSKYKVKTKEYKFTCNFNADGGTVSQAKKDVVYGKQYGTLPTPTKSGYNFIAWYLGSTKIISTTLVKTAKTHTLKAQYKGKEYTINLNPEGGTCTQSTYTVTYGSPYGNLPTAKRSGFKFVGWYTKEGKKASSNAIFNDINIENLYARWRRALSKVTGVKIKYKPKKVQISWKKQKNVTGYKVYGKANKGKWKLYKTTSKTKYTTPKLSSKKKYSFRVRSYYKNKYGSASFSKNSSIVSRASTYVKKPKIKVKYTTDDEYRPKATISWSCKGIKKFHIQKKVNGKWRTVTKSASKKSFWIYINSGKKYSYRIRGYKTVLKHKCYGKYKMITFKR